MSHYKFATVCDRCRSCFAATCFVFCSFDIQENEHFDTFYPWFLSEESESEKRSARKRKRTGGSMPWVSLEKYWTFCSYTLVYDIVDKNNFNRNFSSPLKCNRATPAAVYVMALSHRSNYTAPCTSPCITLAFSILYNKSADMLGMTCHTTNDVQCWIHAVLKPTTQVLH